MRCGRLARVSCSTYTIRFGAVRVCGFVTKGTFVRRGYNGQVQAHQKEPAREDQPRHPAYSRLRFRRERHERARARFRYPCRPLVRELASASRAHECGQSTCGVLGRKRLRRRAQGVFLWRSRVRGPIAADCGVLWCRARQGRQNGVHRRPRCGFRR